MEGIMIKTDKVWKRNKDKSFELTNLKLNQHSLGSNYYIRVVCDYCLILSVNPPTAMYQQYNNYNKSRRKIKMDCCPEHQGLKNQDVAMELYGVKHFMQVPEINKKAADKLRISIETIRNEFKERGLVLESIKYERNSDNLIFYCPRHPSKGLQDITYANFKYGRNGKGSGCWWCSHEEQVLGQTGEKSHFWKGGKTSLHYYLRQRLSDWKKESLKSYDYKCVLTGETKNLEVHHLHSFNLIIDEILKDLNLPLHDEIGEYNEDELSKIESKNLEKHRQYPLGVPITKSLHKQFHTIYGDNASIEDFKAFMNKYDKQKLDLNFSSSLKKRKYFPYKKNRSSKYQYVSFVTSENKWQVSIPIHCKSKNIGRFNSEYEAAEACNEKLIEINGENATINKLDEKDKPLDYGCKKEFFEKKNNCSSIYFGVHKDKKANKWVARVRYGEERIRIGEYETEWLAAEAFNRKAKKLFGNEALLNQISNEHLQEKVNYIPKKKTKSSKYKWVSFNKRDKKWCASVYWNGERNHIGYYSQEIQAAKAYNEFIVEHNISRALNQFN
jgi:hypothetical protein